MNCDRIIYFMIIKGTFAIYGGVIQSPPLSKKSVLITLKEIVFPSNNVFDLKIRKVQMGAALVTGIHVEDIYRFIYSDNEGVPFSTDYYNPTNIITNSKSELEIIVDSIIYCFDNKFLPFLKSKLIEENAI